ncbi:MAG: hypothetical protein ACLFSR_03870 [Halomonas sp.]
MARHAPFPIDEHLTQIALAYHNRDFIADRVMPRVTVGKQEFNYYVHNKGDAFTVPETRVGRKSRPNEVSFEANERTDSTRDYGLDDVIPHSDMENADERYNPLDYSTEMLSELLELDRERRVAEQTFNPDTYGSSHTEALSSTDKWDTPDSKPLQALTDAIETPLVRPNVLVLGSKAWTKLSMHPELVKAMHGTSGDAGRISRSFLAELLEIDEILVGQAFANSANQAQDPNIKRLWGNHAALIYRNSNATTRGGVTFGLTAQWGDRVAGQWEERDAGLRGGTRVRVGWSLRELVVAPDVGYLFQDVVE